MANHACMNLQIAEAQPLFCKERFIFSSTVGRGAGRETCGVYRCLQQCRVLPYLGKPFHEGLVAGGLLHVVVELHPHQQACADAQRRFEQHSRVRGERTAAVQDVVQHFVGYARLCGKLRLRQVAAFDFLLKQFTRMDGTLASIFFHILLAIYSGSTIPIYCRLSRPFPPQPA